MEDQGKRLLLAVAVAFALMMAWSYLFPPEKPAPEKGEDGRDEVAEVERPADEAAAPDAAEAEAEVAEPTAEPAKPRGAEQVFEFPFERFHARFSSYGGSLVSWTLRDEQLVDRAKGSPDDMVEVVADGSRPLAIGFADGSSYKIPAGAEWRGQKKSDTEIRFTWESDALRVIKDFKIYPDHFAVELTVDVEVRSSSRAKQALFVTLSGYQDPKADTGGGMSQQTREWKAACLVDGETKTASAKTLAQKGPIVRAGEIGWAGFLHSYFLAAAAPENVAGRRLECRMRSVGEVPGQMAVDLVFPTVDLEPGAPIQETMVAYLGPKYLDELEAIPTVVGYGDTLDQAVDLGWLGFLAGPLLWLLKWFYGFVGSWGIAIMLLTLVVKALTLPWTHKSMKSMQAMAKLRPQLEKLREKYKDDRQKQQVETMNLFKAHKVNPAAGCLPMLLQMPIWFALYRSLTVAAELYQANFLWLTDLTLPDPLYILPVVLTGLMFLQTKLTPSAATGAQQKVMLYGMPIMFGGMSLFFPSGLTFYILVNTVLTALHHLYMHRGKKAEEAAAPKSAAGAVVEASATERPASPERPAPASPRPSGARKGGGKRKGKKKGR